MLLEFNLQGVACMNPDELKNLKADKVVDARGMACPGPLLEAKKAITADPGRRRHGSAVVGRRHEQRHPAVGEEDAVRVPGRGRGRRFLATVRQEIEVAWRGHSARCRRPPHAGSWPNRKNAAPGWRRSSRPCPIRSACSCSAACAKGEATVSELRRRMRRLAVGHLAAPDAHAPRGARRRRGATATSSTTASPIPSCPP